MKNEFNNNSSKEKLTDKDAKEYGTTDPKEGEGTVQKDEKLPYPKSVFFIITNEFCERFSYYGMKAVLAFYLKNVLLYSEDTSTVVYHVFAMLCYFTPIFGAIIADSFLGKFKTILYLSLVYALGNIILSLASIPPLQIPQEPFSLLGLVLIAVGTGGIKPCVSAFGGDQFVLPQQEIQLTSFFSIFYFSINAGSLISTFITPLFRTSVSCFNDFTCYPLAFGVPAILMIISLVVFVVGYRWYTMTKVAGNVTVDVAACISHALREKSKSPVKRDHWLDYASSKYDTELIESVKTLLNILVLYIPIPVFWALFDQQGSRWTFQAARMNGDTFGWSIRPDQMQFLNPFLILLFIPVFDQGIYPVLRKVGVLTKPLQRLGVGGILAGIAFVISGIVELNLEPTYAVKLENGQSHLNFMSDVPCLLKVQIGNITGDLKPFDQYMIKRIESGEYTAIISGQGECANYKKLEYRLTTQSEEARSYLISRNNNDNTLTIAKLQTTDILEKDGEGNPIVKFMFVGLGEDAAKGHIRFRSGESYANFKQVIEQPKGSHGPSEKAKLVQAVSVTTADTPSYGTGYNDYKVELVLPAIETKDIRMKVIQVGNSTVSPKQGGNYLYVIKRESADEYSIREHIITEPNSMHILWLVPQYVVITAAEVMFSITGITFSYSEAPASMKSVLQACWLMTVAFGNVIVIFVAKAKFFQEQSKEFFLFAGLMFLDMILFAFLAYRYKSTQVSQEKKDDPPMEMKENKAYDDYES